MSRLTKLISGRNIIVPAVIAVVITAAFFAVLPIVGASFPFSRDTVVAAQHETKKVNSVYSHAVQSADKEVKKSSLSKIKNDTVFGEISIDGDTMELIYNAESKNAVKRYNLSGNGVLVGEIGCSYIECYKSDSDALKSIKNGGIVKIDTSYGSYQYRVVKTAYAKNEFQLSALGEDIGRAVVLYTDGSSSPGICESYYAVVCEMISGAKIVE